VNLNGIHLDAYQTTPIARLRRVMQYFHLSTLAKGLFMQKLPALLINPAAIFEISHFFTKPQLLAIYESIVPLSGQKPSCDSNLAFELVMSEMRKRLK